MMVPLASVCEIVDHLPSHVAIPCAALQVTQPRNQRRDEQAFTTSAPEAPGCLPPGCLGLLRHFPVELSLPSGWKTSADLRRWLTEYDASAVVPGTADLGDIPWARCLSSDSARAWATAQAVFTGPMERTPLLREPDFVPFSTGGLRLPVWLWLWVVRLAWLTGHGSQRACRDDFRCRVMAVADRLVSEAGPTLVVSHAGMMAYLSAELRRRGFAGPRLRMAKHATLYVYERGPGVRTVRR